MEVLADDVPIPADTRIVSAPPQTPEAAKQFLGAWAGSWGGLLHHVLIVESIDSNGVASVVYAVGDTGESQQDLGNLVGQEIAEFFVRKGLMVAFPQRRGRGKSDGLYDEGFAPDRAQGYTCDPQRSLAGADRALDDIEAAVTALKQRPDIE